jgi:hypothetical protein
MMTKPSPLPSLPEIGHPESYYAKLAHSADKVGDVHAHEAAKVGQYITLAMNPALSWEEKLKYFRHALRRHCQPPQFPDENAWLFYRQLAELVRQYAGTEALRIASQEDDLYAARLSLSQTREQIEDEAESFFAKIMGSGDERADWFNETDWAQLKLIRDQWI